MAREIVRQTGPMRDPSRIILSSNYELLVRSMPRINGESISKEPEEKLLSFSEKVNAFFKKIKVLKAQLDKSKFVLVKGKYKKNLRKLKDENTELRYKIRQLEKQLEN